MEDKRNLTVRVREVMPEILRHHKNGLSFKQLRDELYVIFGSEMIDSAGEIRDGVLRGITNKINEIPVKNVVYEKVGTRNVYRYVGNEIDEIDREIDKFLNALSEKGLLSIDTLKLSKEEYDKYIERQSAILALNELIKK